MASTQSCAALSSASRQHGAHLGRQRDGARPLHASAMEMARSNERAHARDELGDVVRLRQVIVRTGVEPIDEIGPVPLYGEHEDGQIHLVERLAQEPADLEPGHRGKLAVEDEHVGPRPVRDPLEHRRAVGEDLDHVVRGNGPASHLGFERAVLEDPDQPSVNARTDLRRTKGSTLP